VRLRYPGDANRAPLAPAKKYNPSEFRRDVTKEDNETQHSTPVLQASVDENSSISAELRCARTSGGPMHTTDIGMSADGDATARATRPIRWAVANA
jgi:hypothetical protein